MSYKNRITIIGNVSQPPKVNFTGDGTPVCNFSIATNHFWKNQNGEKQTESTYFQCSAWDKLVPRVETLKIRELRKQFEVPAEKLLVKEKSGPSVKIYI